MAKAKEATTKHIETAAEAYRRRLAENLERLLTDVPADAELHDFTSPSGTTWKLRKPNVASLIEAGALPLSFAERMLQAQTGNGVDVQKMSSQDQARSIRFTSTIVRYCAVVPQIVECPENGDQIGFDEVSTADYKAISQWAMTGGDEGKNLETFRGE